MRVFSCVIILAGCLKIRSNGRKAIWMDEKITDAD